MTDADYPTGRKAALLAADRLRQALSLLNVSALDGDDYHRRPLSRLAHSGEGTAWSHGEAAIDMILRAVFADDGIDPEEAGRRAARVIEESYDNGESITYNIDHFTRDGWGDEREPIRKMLDLSTSHLPERYGSAELHAGLAGADGVIAYAVTHGWLMWVPSDPAESAGVEIDGVPPEVLAVQVYARERGCDYVLFDADGEVVAGLPTWDW